MSSTPCSAAPGCLRAIAKCAYCPVLEVGTAARISRSEVNSMRRCCKPHRQPLSNSRTLVAAPAPWAQKAVILRRRFFMNSIFKVSGSLGQLSKILIWNFARLLFGIAMAVLLLNPAFAQYSGERSGSGGGYGSSGKSIGVAVRAAGAGVGLQYLRHDRSAIRGCVSQTNHALSLRDEKMKRRQQTYFLLPGKTGLKPGELKY